MICDNCGADHPKDCACLPLSNSFEVFKVPIPNWLSKRQKGLFASKHIAMQKGDKEAVREIDNLFELLIEGHKFQSELNETEKGTKL